MKCRILLTESEVVFIATNHWNDAESLQVTTIRSKAEEPVLTSRLHPRWALVSEQMITPSWVDRWRIQPGT